MAVAETVASLVNEMPDLDESGKVTGIDPAAAEKIGRKLLEQGPEGIIALVDLLVPPGAGNDSKARHLLHALSVYVCGNELGSERAMLGETLAAQLGGDRHIASGGGGDSGGTGRHGGRPKAVQRFVIQQLQVMGRKEDAAKLGELLLDPELCEPAAQALVAVGDGAVQPLSRALSEAGGACRRTIVQALGPLAAKPPSPEAAREQIDTAVLREHVLDADEQVRLAALWALAKLADAEATDAVLHAADTEHGFGRIKATQASLLLAENLAAAGRKADARRIYTHLQSTRTDDAEAHIRHAAESGLAALG